MSKQWIWHFSEVAKEKKKDGEKLEMKFFGEVGGIQTLLVELRDK
jgi:hypothetical protein